MITFEKLKFRNFMSYGGAWSELTLNDSQLTAIAAKNASGKCLDPKTNVNIRFTDLETAVVFNSKKPKTETKTTIGQLYEFFKLWPERYGHVLVETRFGYKKILA